MYDDRLPILTFAEAHVLLDVLHAAAERDDVLGDDAAWLFGELAARLMSRREDDVTAN
ncbi:hypothetical protein ACFRLW_27475 [Streptomyces sp. NPDC056728]